MLTTMPLGQMVTMADLQIPIHLRAQCVFFGRFFGNFDVSSLYTEHESVFFGPDPCMRPAVKRETKKKSALNDGTYISIHIRLIHSTDDISNESNVDVVKRVNHVNIVNYQSKLTKVDIKT